MGLSLNVRLTEVLIIENLKENGCRTKGPDSICLFKGSVRLIDLSLVRQKEREWLVYNKTNKMGKKRLAGTSQKRRNEETHNLSEVG